MSYDYEVPSFLEGNSADEIHARMLAVLPSDIDKSENSIPWDFTRPPALEKAEFVQFQLNETIKMIFPQWAYGSWLDYHAEIRNVTRKAANKAFGILHVTGILGTVIPEGFTFATASSLTASVLFQTLEEITLDGVASSGKVTLAIEVEAVEGGISGNVAVDTVKLMATPLTGITYVTNPEPMSGGTALEDDEDLRARVLEAILLGTSFTGCNSDYIRWAKEISGVGYVVVEPEWDDPTLPDNFHYTDSSGKTRCAGAVRLLIADDNGQPANEQIIEDVYAHIMGEDEKDYARLAPIGAHVTVSAPESLEINVTASLHLDEGELLSVAKGRILTNLAAYWVMVAADSQVASTGVSAVRYVQVGAVIAKTLGVLDYKDLKVNGLEDVNISVSQAQYPVTGEVDFLVY